MLKQWEQLLKTLGQSTRLKMVLLLAAADGLCTTELERVLGISQPAVSQHMRLLKSLSLVEEQREGSWVYYRLSRALLVAQLQQLAALLESSVEERLPDMAAEWQRLQKLQAEPLTPQHHRGISPSDSLVTQQETSR